MHAAAKQIVQLHEGRFPDSYEQVLALPGIGRYTAGAILSIVENQRLPILEGNTQRVFSRWVALRGPVTDSSATKLLWEIAEAIASSRPAEVDSAAARPPAATSAITQFGKLAISGLASTMMSRSTLIISLPFQP